MKYIEVLCPLDKLIPKVELVFELVYIRCFQFFLRMKRSRIWSGKKFSIVYRSMCRIFSCKGSLILSYRNHFQIFTTDPTKLHLYLIAPDPWERARDCTAHRIARALLMRINESWAWTEHLLLIEKATMLSICAEHFKRRICQQEV